MNGDPITRQRSAWQLVDQPGLPWHLRRVHDGTLRAIVADEPIGWHMSISHVDHKGQPRRYPTWDEISHARDELLPADVAFVMHLPVASEYVAVHPTTFHLYEHPERACSGPDSSTPERLLRMTADPTVVIDGEPWTVDEFRSFATGLRDQHDPKEQDDNPYNYARYGRPARCAVCHYVKHPCDVYDLASIVLALLPEEGAS